MSRRISFSLHWLALSLVVGLGCKSDSPGEDAGVMADARVEDSSTPDGVSLTDAAATDSGAVDAYVIPDRVIEDPADFLERREWVLRTFADFPGRSATALSTLYFDSTDEEAQAVMLSVVCDSADDENRNQAVPPAVYALGLYWDSFPMEMKTQMRDCVKEWRGIDNHGTENHALLQHMAGYLFTQWFPGEEGWRRQQGDYISSEEMNVILSDKMMAIFRSLYEKGYAENLSTTYDMLHIYPILAIRMFADDPVLTNAAEAALLFHFANIAMNSFHGMTISPFQRSNYQAVNANFEGVQPNMPFTHYLYWPEGTNITREPSVWTSFPLNGVIAYNASVDWRPPDVIRAVATGDTPAYSARTGSTEFGFWGEGNPHETMRSVYRTGAYAIGTGFLRYIPGSYYFHHKNFMIAYESPDTYNYVESSQNYWNSDHDEDYAWRRCVNSPFQQVAHHENTVISLFNIPESDPWRDLGRADFSYDRDEHYDDLIQRADTRFPKAVDETVERDGWVFLREADTYIGIKTLQPYVIDTETSGLLAEFNVIRSEGAQNAIVYELGTLAEHGDFASFQESLIANPITVDWEDLSVEYRDSDGDTLRAVWDPPAYDSWDDGEGGVDEDARVMVRPETFINDVREPDFAPADWPVLDSPHVRLVGRILTVSHGSQTLSVDWSAEQPVITRPSSDL